MNLSAAQIQQYAANAGFSGMDLAIATAIALAESSGNPGVIGDQDLAPDNGPSIGLWQINIGANPQFASMNLTDPQTNANAAFAMYSAAGGFLPWTTYTSMAYEQYLDSVPSWTALVGTPAASSAPALTSAFSPATSVMTLFPSVSTPNVASSVNIGAIALALALGLGVVFAFSEG